MGRLGRFATAVCLCLLTSPALAAAGAGTSNLVAQGIAATRQGQWTLAIRYFKQAHALDPTNPGILLNIGLANDRAGGRELLAIAWFQAFQAAAPTSPTAPQVQKRISALELTVEGHIQKLLDTAGGIVREADTAAGKAKVLDAVIQAYADDGDVGRARSLMARLPANSKPGWGLAEIAAHEAWSGNIDLANSDAKAIKGAHQRAWAMAEIAVALARRKDFDMATTTAEKVTHHGEKAYALSRVAALRAEAGDRAGAERLLKDIKDRFAADRAMVLAIDATATARGGDEKTARQSIAAATKLLDAIQQYQTRLAVEAHLARAQALLGNTDAANGMMARMGQSRAYYRALQWIAQDKGDVAKAEIYRRTANAMALEETLGTGDINAVLDAAKGKAPADAGVSVADAAQNMALALARLREPD